MATDGRLPSNFAKGITELSPADIARSHAPHFLVFLGARERDTAPDKTRRDLRAIDDDDFLIEPAAPSGADEARLSLGLVVFPILRRPTSSSDFIEIGRLDVNDIVLHHESVSGFHAWLLPDESGGFCRLVDKGSRGGTFVDGDKLAPEGARLRSGQNVRFGAVSMAFLDAAAVLDLARTHSHSPNLDDGAQR